MAVDESAVIIVIGGELVTPFARVGRVRIDDLLNDTPNTASLTIVLTNRVGPPSSGPFDPGGFDAGAFATAIVERPILVPPPINAGAPIALYLGAVSTASQIFGGQITTREQYAVFDQPEHVRLDLTCIDYSRRLNRRKVIKEYKQASATAIVLDLIATFAPGITTAHVQPSLPTISGGITLTFEEVSRSLSRIAEKIGAYWYVDYIGDLHFFTGTEAGPVPAPIVPGADFANLKLSADLTQVRTRVIVEGDGSTALIAIPAGAGAGVKPVASTSPFNAAGGMAKVGTSRVTYTGIHPGGVKTNTVGVGSGSTPPPSAPIAPVASVAPPSTLGGLSGGPYQYAVTFELGDGSRSDLGAPSSPVTITAASNPPATSSALFGTPTKGPIAVGVASTYATSFVDASGRETVATLGGNTVTGRAVADPTSQAFYGTIPDLSSTLAPGSYVYAMSFYTATGETLSIQQRVDVAQTGLLVRAQFPAAPDNRVIGRRLYRSSVSALGDNVPKLPWHHVIDVPNNTANVTHDDRIPDASLPTKAPPSFNSATDVGEAATVYIPTSIDSRIVRRRIYRQDGAGQMRGIAEIPDNSTTAFNDVVVGAGSGALAPTVNNVAQGAVNLSGIAIGPAGTVRRRIFRTVAGGNQFRELTALGDNATTALIDATPDSNLGGSPLPAQGGAGSGAPPTAIGSQSIRVASLAGFPATGWVAVEGQVIFYASAGDIGGGALALYGIPGSGLGSITAEIPAGTVVNGSPAIVGLNPDVDLSAGDEIQLIVQVDDVPAQQAIAAVEGGDGIIEHYIQDRRLSETGARSRGLADLALFKTIELRLSYTTHDLNTQSGRTVHVDLPAPTNITGDFLIQRVTIDEIAQWKNQNPRRSVDASTTRFSFEDVLNRILLEQA